jgi:hypothetical protein
MAWKKIIRPTGRSVPNVDYRGKHRMYFRDKSIASYISAKITIYIEYRQKSLLGPPLARLFKVVAIRHFASH